VNVGALAEALVMDAGGLAHTLKPLERDGLVAVAVDPSDRRNRLIRLTRLGRRKLSESDELWTRAQFSFDVALGKMQSQELRAAMQLLISNQFAASFEQNLANPPIRPK
jgi:DNA-binding MarR family transcriptional regulator